MDDILTNIQYEGQTPEQVFGDTDVQKPDEQVETPAAPSAEKDQPEPSPSSGGEPSAEKPEDNNQNENKLPFNKHPRWKAVTDENAALKQTLKEFMDSQRQVLDRVAPPAQQAQTQAAIPDWFTKAYGNDPEVWATYQNFLKEQTATIKAELKREEEAVKAQQEAETKKWNDWADQGLAQVEETYGVKLKQGESKTNEFIKFMLDVLPSDQNGNLDLVKGYKIFMDMHKEQDVMAQAKASAKKSLASVTTAPDKASTAKPKDFFTQKDLRSKGWKSLF